MARRFPQPYYRTRKERPGQGCWYVQLGGKQVRLDPDREEAFRLYHELMARGPTAPKSSPISPLVLEILDAFLGWCQRNRAKPTYAWYRHHLQLLASAVPPALPVSDLRPHHLTAVLAAHGNWSRNSQHDFVSCCQRALNWAFDEGLIDRSPIARVKKPAREARELAVSPAEYEAVMGAVTEPGFRDLIALAWEIGARVQELRIIEARHRDGNRLVLPPSEAKGKLRHRVIYLTGGTAEAIVGRLSEAHPAGPLLRNSKGKPWTKDAINCAFGRLEKRLGKRYHLGAFRKGFATQALKAGVDTVTVGHLLGHADGVMVSRVYGHVQQDPAHMADAARRAKGGTNEPGQ